MSLILVFQFQDIVSFIEILAKVPSVLVCYRYTHAHLWFPPLFLAVNHHNIENWVPSILTHNLWLIFMGMKQKYFFFIKLHECRMKSWESMISCIFLKIWQKGKFRFKSPGSVELWTGYSKKYLFPVIKFRVHPSISIKFSELLTMQ